MVSILSKVVNKFTKDGKMKIRDMELEELKETQAELKADLDLKRNKHEGLSEKRRAKFDQLKDTEDDLLGEELAEEIASIEDEMSIYHNEHSQLMDTLRVIDGLIAVKRKQELMEDQGIVQEIEEMDREEVVDALKREDVQEMIRSEKWNDLQDMFRGDLKPRKTGSKRVQEIMDAAKEHSDKNTDEALKIRDQQRKAV